MLMKHIFHWLLLAFVLLTCLAAQMIDGATEAENFVKDNDLLQNIESNEILPESREYIYSLLSRQALRKILNQMPCGWPAYGIPPLAPYERDDWEFSLKNNITDTQISVQQLRLEGLNDVDIDKLEVSYTFKNLVEFDLNFRNITALGKFKADISLSLANLTGIDLSRVRASGDLNLSLQDLRLTGSFKYKLPILLGSARIFDFKVVMTLGNVDSQLKGTANALPITGIINRGLETFILKTVNTNQIIISGILERLIEPIINAQLFGKKLWNVILWSLRLYTMDECSTKGVNYAMEDIIANVI